MSREKDLAQDGWQKQSTNDEPRLSELVQLYVAIGYDVHLEPVDPNSEPECTTCMRWQPEKYKTIYTRKKAP